MKGCHFLDEPAPHHARLCSEHPFHSCAWQQAAAALSHFRPKPRAAHTSLKQMQKLLHANAYSVVNPAKSTVLPPLLW